MNEQALANAILLFICCIWPSAVFALGFWFCGWLSKRKVVINVRQAQ